MKRIIPRTTIILAVLYYLAHKSAHTRDVLRNMGESNINVASIKEIPHESDTILASHHK